MSAGSRWRLGAARRLDGGDGRWRRWWLAYFRSFGHPEWLGAREGRNVYDRDGHELGSRGWPAALGSQLHLEVVWDEPLLSRRAPDEKQEEK